MELKVIERFYHSIRYEYVYEIDGGPTVAERVMARPALSQFLETGRRPRA